VKITNNGNESIEAEKLKSKPAASSIWLAAIISMAEKPAS